ncbi:serine/threonine-protein kinase [Streptomyces odontomachi]|uniref:serine/threonine-protein kinase n=1 Tax=Streptomyces odontomachi TaxID=2944940 RepID=UPI002108860A|nr:serine/threonine-protein kinase [Streptomyces sp. ODS25]
MKQDTTPLPVPLRVGEPRTIAGYPLHARIGEGGMGTVFLSRTRGGQPIAIKLIRPEYAQDAAFRERFTREVAAARRVSGYHLLPVVDHDTQGEHPWLATRYVPGIPLDAALGGGSPLPLPVTLQLLACVASALHAVHTADVVHRDVKPGNILLAADGPWLLDFGIARAASAATFTTMGRLVGTPRYMSPEHALGRRATTASDVFALGLVAAEAATGRHPYGRGNALAVAARIAGTDREPPVLDDVPEPLRAIVRSCLAAAPGHRPSAATLAQYCAGAARHDVRDFAGWLPEPLAAEVTRVERAVAGLSAFAEAPTVRSLPATAPITVQDPEAETASEWLRRVRRKAEPESPQSPQDPQIPQSPQ